MKITINIDPCIFGTPHGQQILESCEIAGAVRDMVVATMRTTGGQTDKHINMDLPGHNGSVMCKCNVIVEGK